MRKVLRSGETSFEYERGVQPRPKLGRWSADLDRLLAVNAEKPARERLTLIRIFETLRDLGYEGGYGAVRRYAKGWPRKRSALTADAFVPLTFAPGEACQFDSHGELWVKGFCRNMARSSRLLVSVSWAAIIILTSYGGTSIPAKAIVKPAAAGGGGLKGQALH